MLLFYLSFYSEYKISCKNADFQVPVTTHYVSQAIASLPPTGPSSVCHTNSAMSTPIPGCCQAVQQVTQGQPVYVNQAANASIMVPYQTQVGSIVFFY